MRCFMNLKEPYCLCCFMQADGLNAEARIGVPGEHRGILSDHHVFRILKTWLNAGEPDPFYDPLNDYVVLPTCLEIERFKEKSFDVTKCKEEWEIIPRDSTVNDDDDDVVEAMEHPISSISVSKVTTQVAGVSVQ